MAVVAVVAAIVLVARRETKEPPPPPSGAGVVEGRLVVPEEVLRASGVQVAAVETGSMPARIRLTGEVELAHDRFAHVTPRIEGAVRELHRTIGDEVASGDPLATIESVSLGEARAAFVSARSELRLAERSYHRWKELFERGLRTQNEFWVAENQYVRAMLGVEAAASRLRALGADDAELETLRRSGSSAVTNRYVLRSPIAGSVVERTVTLGQFVTTQDRAFTVTDLSEVWVQASLYQEDLGLVRRGAPATVRIHGIEDASFAGEVTYVGQQVDERTRTVPIRVRVPNGPLPGSTEPFGLRPSMFATVDLLTLRREGVIVVPAPAVVTEADSSVATDVVFVATRADGKLAFEKRRVSTGAREGGLVEVSSGLAPGERVAVRNAHLLASELKNAHLRGPS